MKYAIPSSLIAVAVLAACSPERGGLPADPTVVSIPVFVQEVRNFRTHATGAEEVPARDTQAQGQAIFQLSKDGTELSYRLIVANIENVTQAHIHRGAFGANGPIAVWLYPPAPPLQLIPGRSDGVLGEGVIRDANVIAGVIPGGIVGLMAHLRAGNTYVNVHTTLYPGGEIRGQID
jgi:hypothetical protein